MTDHRTLEEELSLPPKVAILCLLKIGQREHLEELAKGHLRFRRLSFYSEMESQEQPYHDKNEGTVGVLQAEYVKFLISFGGEQVEVSRDTGLLDQVIVQELRTRMVFCLHAIHTGEWTFREFDVDVVPEFRRSLQVPKSMGNHGDHAWVLTDCQQFRARLLEAVRRRNLGLQGRLVRYVDFTATHGYVPSDIRGFVKSAEYREEREYRIQLDTGGTVVTVRPRTS
jgi:hypothetical protein